MKKLSKIFACTTVALLMTSCGNPIDNAKKAIEKEDFVEAAECLGELTVEDINEMDAAKQMEVIALGVAIEMSGDKEANKILNKKIDFDKIEKKELSLDNLFGL